ncbi:MAG: dienelactone hydrolase family protein [Alphaproteobacteria bacterium]
MLLRRDVLKGLGAGGIGSLPLATVLADPKLARAAAGMLDTVSIDLSGGKTVSASLAMPTVLPAPTMILIHEWWGLNNQIKAVAAEFANKGAIALAIDLMDGQVATTPDQARAQMGAVGDNPDVAVETCVAWADWLRSHDGSNGKLGTCGWCFGGGWSLNTSIATPVDATVIYYGRVNKTAEEVATLKGPVLGHFATQDGFINQDMVGGFEAAMAEAGKDLTVHWYDADHAFANPTSARYDEGDAALAWDRTMAFLSEQLGMPG